MFLVLLALCGFWMKAKGVTITSSSMRTAKHERALLGKETELFKDEFGYAKSPETWNELIVEAMKLTEPEKGVYGWSMCEASSSQVIFPVFCILARHNSVGAFSVFAPDDRLVFDRPTCYRISEFWTDAFRKYKVTPLTATADYLGAMFLALGTEKTHDIY